MALFVEDGDLCAERADCRLKTVACAQTAQVTIVTLIHFKWFYPCNSSDSKNSYTGFSHLTAFSNNPFSSSTVNS